MQSTESKMRLHGQVRGQEKQDEEEKATLASCRRAPSFGRPRLWVVDFLTG